jgi:hypothetical protein
MKIRHAFPQHSKRHGIGRCGRRAGGRPGFRTCPGMPGEIPDRIAVPPARLETAPLRRLGWMTGPRGTGSADQAGRPLADGTCRRSRRSGSVWPSDGDEGAGMACGTGFVSLSAGRLRAKLPPARRLASDSAEILTVPVPGVPAAACGPPPAPKKEASRTCLPGPGEYRLHPRRLCFLAKSRRLNNKIEWSGRRNPIGI